MIDMTKLAGMLEDLSKGMEKRFSGQAGYEKVKALLEGKAGKVDTASLVVDARALFSGDNSPELLAAHTINGVKELVSGKIATVRDDIGKAKQLIHEGLEKCNAVMEERAAAKEISLAAGEVALKGRLVMDDGKTPVAGARVVVHGTGRNYTKIVTETVTDANGEYLIKFDEKAAKAAPDKVKIAFDAPDGENVSLSADVALKKGKVYVMDNVVAEDKRVAASRLTRTSEDRRKMALMEKAGLKQSDIELQRYDNDIQEAMSAVAAELDGLKRLFSGKDG